MAQTKKRKEKCGFFAILLMMLIGTIFGCIGVMLTHYGMKYYPEYYLLLIFPIIIGLFLGSGLKLGARLGRCCRLNIFVFLLVLVFSVVSYGSFLFLNHYYDSLEQRPTVVFDELFLLKDDIQNFLAALPYVADYVSPVAVAEETEPRPNIGTQIADFVMTTLPQQAFSEEPVVIGTIFNQPFLAFAREYIEVPGFTRWDEERQWLVFDEMTVKPWMVWTGEFFFLWLIVLLKTRKGAKKARQKQEARLKKSGGWGENRSSKKQKKGRKPVEQTRLDMTPSPPAEEEALDTVVIPKPKKKLFSFGRKKKTTEEPAGDSPTLQAAPEKPKNKKKKGGWFGKKTTSDAETIPETPQKDVESVGEVQDQRYALILHQYDAARQKDLVWLIQQISKISEDRAQKLLKVPSLLKRDVSTQDAQIAIEKFQQVQAQVKLITMQQLESIQQKQQQGVRQSGTAQAAPPSSSAPANVGGSEETCERYALILRKIDAAYRKQVLDLLASLSNTPVAQLRQSLKTPALVLRDATKDEVTMIAQQFGAIHADVKVLSMPELQKLMARK